MCSGGPIISGSAQGEIIGFADVARDMFDSQVTDGYMFDVEILYLARQLGYRIQQVPVCWRDDGDSRLNPIAGTIQNVRDLLRIRFHRYKNNSRVQERA